MLALSAVAEILVFTCTSVAFCSTKRNRSQELLVSTKRLQMMACLRWL